MAELKDVIAYLIKNYPSTISDELSNARLTKLIYLTDWKSCLSNGRQVSSIDWYFDNHGPYVHDVIETASANPSVFNIVETSNAYGGRKRIIKLAGAYEPKIKKNEAEIIDRIIEITRKMYWSEFINLVYSTYPITSSERYSKLNLAAKAGEYKKKEFG
jgi:hypothetical protein